MTTIARNYITIANIEDGKQGKPGEGGLSVMAIPSHLTFDTDQNGTILLTNNNANKARIVVFEGLKSVNPESITLKPYNCQASRNDDTITINSIDQGQANGRVEVAATYRGNTYTTSLTFYVSKQRWNDAKFTTIKGQFESIQEEFERVDGEITDTKSTINQLPEKITLEVLRHENGINLLKGASLSYPTVTIDGKEHNILAGATIEQGALSHNEKPYLQVNKSRNISNEYDGARFVAKVKANKTYTLSMYYRVVRSADQGFHLIPELKDKYNGTTKKFYHYNQTILQNNQWQRYENTFTTNQDGYLHFNPSVKRNGWIVFSEIQLEEGNKATPWTNPDKDERFKRAGIDLDLEHIVLQAGKVYTKNAKGETTSLVDEEGNFATNTLQTFNKQGGSVYIHDGIIEVRNPSNITQIKIGYDPKGDKTVMSFFNKLGQFIADLDPSALQPKDVTQARWEPIRVTQLSTQASDTALEAIKNDTWLMSRIMGLQVKTFRFENLYIYTAPMIQGSFRPDGQWNGEQTKANNGLVFKNRYTYNNEKANGIFIMEYFFTRPRIPLRDENGVEHPIEIIPEFVIIKDGKWRHVRDPELSNPHSEDF